MEEDERQTQLSVTKKNELKTFEGEDAFPLGKES